MSAQASADFEIYGYDMTMTDSVAARLKRELLTVKGVTEVNISRSDYQPEYQVDFDREKLAMHGLTWLQPVTTCVIVSMVPLLPNIVKTGMSMISKCAMHPNIVQVWKASRTSLFIMPKASPCV